MTKKKWWISVSLILIIIVSAAIFYSSRLKNDYEWINPHRGPIFEAIYGLGTVKSNKVYELKLGTSNSIKHLSVSEGAQVKRGQRLLDLTEGYPIVAPFDGTVTSLPFHENENIFPQAVVLRLENLMDSYVEVTLEQQGALRVREGQKARLSFESLREEKVSGVVESIYPSQGQFLVRIKVKNFPPQLLPGMTADVAIEVGRSENALLIPVQSIFNGKVTLKREGRVKKVDVKIGRADNEWAEVLDSSILEADLIRMAKRKSP